MDSQFWTTLLGICEREGEHISDFIFSANQNLLYYKSGSLTQTDMVVPEDFFIELVKKVNGDSLSLERDRDQALILPAAKGCFRFRVNLFRQRDLLRVVARLLPRNVIAFDKIGLPKKAMDSLAGAVDRPGLILVTGPTGSGKNTTVAAYLNSLVVRVPGHFVTLEDPIEHQIGEGTGFEYRVSQREVGRDVESFEAGLHSILRQAPKVIFIGEIRDKYTASKALEASQTGHLVISTMHTTSAAETVDRFIRFFTPPEIPFVTATMSEVLRMVICQRLELRVNPKEGRLALFEVLIPTVPIKNMISDNKVADIRSQMEIGGSTGQQTFEMAYKNAEKEGRIVASPNRFK